MDLTKPGLEADWSTHCPSDPSYVFDMIDLFSNKIPFGKEKNLVYFYLKTTITLLFTELFIVRR